jgi:hypothetical protein
MDTRLVRVVCANCDANYRIGAEMVRGKVVDYCCSSCGAVIEVDGTAIELVAPTRPGEDPRARLPRTPEPTAVDPSSGAFRVNPPPSRSDTPAGLVRIKPPPPPTEAFAAHHPGVQSSMPPPMSMPSRDVVENVRPLSSSPSEFAPPSARHAAEPQSSRRGLWIVGTLAAAAAVAFIGRTIGGAINESQTPAAAVQPAEAPTPMTTRLQPGDFRGTTTDPAQAPAPHATTTPPKVAPGNEVNVESLKAEKRKKKAKKAASAEDSDPIAEETPSEPTPPPVATFVAPEPPPPPGPEFSTDAAHSALEDAAARAATCRDNETEAGAVRVAVTFVPSGQATVAVVESGPVRGTPVGSCVASKFRTAKVPPFSGPKVTVHKTMNF